MRVFEAQENALAEIDARIAGLTWEQIATSRTVHELLHGTVASSPHMDGAWLIAPEGRTVNSADFFPVPLSIVTERDYFKALRASGGTYLGQVIQGNLKRNLNFNIGRRRSSPSGGFDGIILITVSLRYFTEFWAGARPDDATVVAIIRDDGSTLARYPAIETLPPKIPEKSPFFQAVKAADSSRFTFTAGSDGRERLYAYSKLGRFPAYAVVGIDRAAILKPWLRQSMVAAGLAALVAFSMGGLVSLAARQQRRLASEALSRRMAEEDLRRSQAALAQREALYATVFRYNVDGIFVVSVGARGEFVVEAYNPAVEILLGRPSSEMAGRPLGELLPPTLYGTLALRLRECIATGQPVSYERSYTFGERRGVWLVTLVPVRDATGAITRVLGANRDVAREREAQREIQESRDRYGALFEHSPLELAVVEVGVGSSFTYSDANPRWLAARGLTREAVVGSAPRLLFPRDEAARIEGSYRRCAESHALIEEETEELNDREPVVRRTLLVPVRDATGGVTKIFVTSIDLTAQRRMEEHLRQAQKLEAVGQLTGGIAHDFNNLLTVVMGNLDLLRRARPERAPRLIDNAMLAVRQGSQVTAQLLAFSRRGPLRPEPTDLAEALADMQDMLAHSLRDDIALVVEVAPGTAAVDVDRPQLQAALINLAANARDAMPGGGTFRISVAQAGGASQGGVAITVADSGAGIAPDHLPRVFDPFFTTKPVGRGTGLGLAQVYGFVQQSGGTVTVKSRPGEGTVFTLVLPRSGGEQPRVRSAPKQVAQASAQPGTARILVVDDNPQLNDLLAAVLSERGYGVERAMTGAEAIARLESGARFDLIVSDIVMPGGIDGFDLGRAVRRRWPATQMILATGYSGSAQRVADEGFTLLQKPFHPDDLAAEVGRVLAARQQPAHAG